MRYLSKVFVRPDEEAPSSALKSTTGYQFRKPFPPHILLFSRPKIPPCLANAVTRCARSQRATSAMHRRKPATASSSPRSLSLFLLVPSSASGTARPCSRFSSLSALPSRLCATLADCSYTINQRRSATLLCSSLARASARRLLL